MRRTMVAGLGCTAALVLSACSGGNAVDVNGSGGSSGTLNAAISGEPDQLDPPNTSSYNSFEVLENVFDTLVEPDAKLNMVPALATSWDTSSDQLSWTFHLRKTNWQDGTPFTSADVAYSFNRIIDGKLPNSYRFAEVKSVEAKDPSTVVITLKQPAPNLLAEIGGFKSVAIVQKKNVESGEIKTHPVGTGPFKLTSWQHGSSITLTANPNYWGGKPKVSTVKFTFVSDPTVALQDLQSGEVQWTDNLPPQQVSSLEKSSDGITVKAVPSNDYWYLALNEAKKPFDDPRVRQAIAFAIDRQAIVKAAKFGNATVNETAIPKTSQWYYNYAPYSTDPAKAKQLLSEAGVSNLTMDMMVTSQYPETVSAAQVMAAELKPLGITVNIRTLDFPTWLDQEGKGQFDSFMLSWLGNIDPDDFYFAQQHTGASFNFQKYSNPTVDQLLDQARTTTDASQRKGLYDKAAKLIVDDASYIYLYNPEVVQGYSSKVHGYDVRADRAIRFRDVSLG